MGRLQEMFSRLRHGIPWPDDVGKAPSTFKADPLKTIYPLQGVGLVDFGMKEAQITRLMGPPDEKRNDGGAALGDCELVYWAEHLVLSLSGADGDRLVGIAIQNKGYALFGRDLHQLSVSQVRSFLLANGSQSGDLVSHPPDTPDENIAMLESENLELTLIFDKGRVSEIWCTCPYDDDGKRPIFPAEGSVGN